MWTRTTWLASICSGWSTTLPGRQPMPDVFWEGCRPNSMCDRSKLRVLQTDFVWFIARRPPAPGREDGD